MCGFAGFWSPDGLGREAERELAAMTGTLLHRGPDDGGAWLDAAGGIALGHRRLSIVDLSALGHQPMFSASERFVLAYNGEVYNFGALRRELEGAGATFRGHSDTEVLLAAFERWGVERTLGRSNGMFALALWDRAERTLTLARDRMGEKPLYYGWAGRTLVFGSELKALRSYRAFSGAIDRDALALYFRHNYVPAPYTIYQGVRKLHPGGWVQFGPGTAAQALPEPMRYWSVREAAQQGAREPLPADPAAALDELEALLLDAVGLRMVADVPLGAFLSGGIDSSLVVALMQRQSTQPVRTFTIGFAEGDYNEAQHAKAVAQHLGTAHSELYVTPAETLAVIPRLPAMYDEPFADSSQVPTALVSAFARQSVTVALSGDGGDELFGGYNRYHWARQIWGKLGWVPRGVAGAVAGAIMRIPQQRLEASMAGLQRVVPRRFRYNNAGDKLVKIAEILGADSREAVYRRLISHWKHPESVVLQAREPLTAVTDSRQWAELDSFAHWMMYLDAVTYLPDDILVKLDRASMAVSLEGRVPLLDHRVVELAWRLPLALKVRNGEGKWVLRQLLERYVPRALFDRPKMGFGVPIGHWLRVELREWAEELLEPARLAREGFLDPRPVQRMWQAHLSGAADWKYHLWDVLMFQAWLESTRSGMAAET